MTKLCSKCNREYPLEFFSKDSKAKDGLFYRCKKCQKEYQDKNRDKARDTLLFRKYNWSLPGYDDLMEKQHGVCAICGKKETAKNQYGIRPLCVDHDHKTNKVRGLLCDKCNRGMGYFDHDSLLLTKVIEYLKKP